LSSLGHRFLVASLIGTLLGTADLSGQVRVDPDGGSPTRDSIRLIVRSGDAPLLMLTRTDRTTTQVNVRVTALSDSLGNVVYPSLSVPSRDTAFATELTGLTLGDAAVPLRLRIPDLRTPITYRGSIVMVTSAATVNFHLAVRSAPIRGAAVLTVVPRVETIVPVKIPLRGDATGEFSVTLTDRTRTWPINGLYARVEELSGPPEASFDPRRDIMFYDGDDTLTGFWSLTSASRDTLAIPAGGQRSVVGRVVIGAPGEYRTKIRFTALDSSDDEAQVIPLVIRARHSIERPLFVLLLGIVASLLLTRGIGAAREQIEYRRTLSGLEVAFLDGEPPSMAVVRVHSTLRKARDFASGFRLAWTDWLAKPIEEEKKRLQRLRRINDLRTEIGKQPQPMVRRRFLKRLKQAGAPLDGPLDDAMLERVDADVAALQQWMDPQSLDGLYGQDLERDVTALSGSVDPRGLDDAAKKIAKAKLDDLKNLPAASLDEKIRREEVYARLKLLWEWRDKGKTAGKAQPGKGAVASPYSLFLERIEKYTLEDLFAFVDGVNWGELSELEIRHLKVEQPDQAETYEPISLRLAPTDGTSGENYLFKHNCRFHWRLELQPTKFLWLFERNPILLEPVTTEPRVVQYAPKGGTLTCSVNVEFKGPLKPSRAPLELKVVPARFAKLYRRLTALEATQFAAAALIAVASGILMFYVTNPVFGSLKDYLAMFLWALAVDQGKNVLQIHSGLSGASPRQP
jgi:hypothetical protein